MMAKKSAAESWRRLRDKALEQSGGKPVKLAGGITISDNKETKED
jgi:hypothetical protein